MRAAFEASYHRVIGPGTPPTEAYLEHMGEAFPRIMDHLGLPRALWEPYREFCRSNIDHVVVVPQSRPLLNWAQAEGLQLAILTGKDRERTLELLAYHRLDDFFEAVVASDELRRPKPHPE